MTPRWDWLSFACGAAAMLVIALGIAFFFGCWGPCQ